MEQYPFGECQCREGCQCQEHPGPAAMEVLRDGVSLLVCTRCDRQSRGDIFVRTLLDGDTRVEVFMIYDPLGLACMALKHLEQDAREVN